MFVSPAGVDLVKGFEGFRAARYLDAVGIPTIGYGHVIQAGESFGVLTEPEAAALLAKDLDRFALGVARLVQVTVTQPQFDALVSLAYNIGLGSFGGSTLLRKLNAGDPYAAAEEFPRWRYAGGKELPGLVRRRAAERALFLTPPGPVAA